MLPNMRIIRRFHCIQTHMAELRLPLPAEEDDYRLLPFNLGVLEEVGVQGEPLTQNIRDLQNQARSQFQKNDLQIAVLQNRDNEEINFNHLIR